MDLLRRWKSWIRPACFTFYIVCLMVALPLCIIELNRKGAPNHVQAWFIGGLFVMMALPISLGGILQHLIYYTQPVLQRHIIRILWMVPIYALNAWFALRFPPAAIYLDTLRECYEAYVIYNFMRYLLNFLHQEHPRLDILLEEKPRVKHFIPFCCLPAWPTGKVFLNRCKHGVMQYTVIRPAMTVVALISQLAGKYDEGDLNFTSTWSYIVVVNNASQLAAMYCLVLFYKATKEELAPLQPLPKFLCVKAVVFLSFWQSTVIAVLAKLNVIPANGTWVFYDNVQEVATGLQDFLICLEMFLAAIAHYYSFSHIPYADAAAERASCCTTFWSMWDVTDMRDDVVDHARYIGRGVQKKLGRGWNNGRSERTPLLTSPDSSVAAPPRPTTPPVMVEEKQYNTGDSSGLYSTGTPNLLAAGDAELERSGETFHVKSTTPSMNNYLDFGSSQEVQPPVSASESAKMQQSVLLQDSVPSYAMPKDAELSSSSPERGAQSSILPTNNEKDSLSVSKDDDDASVEDKSETPSCEDNVCREDSANSSLEEDSKASDSEMSALNSDEQGKHANIDEKTGSGDFFTK